MPKVSVFMPSYNHALWVAMAIESIRCQTYQDFEIVVTDDGSTDGTPDIIAGLNEPRLHLKRFPRNRGAAVATNDAIRRCTGEYLTLLNSDDMFLPEKLAQQVAFLDAHPHIGAVFGHMVFVDENNRPLPREYPTPNRSQEEWLRHFFFVGNALAHPTIMVRRECYHKLGGYDERMAQIPDFHMWIRLVSLYPIHVLPQKVTAYRWLQNAANASAPRPDSIVRTAWEEVQVKKYYLTLPEWLFGRVFARELALLGLDARGDRRIVLGRLCLATSSPTLHRLGLELLFDALPPQSAGRDDMTGFSHADFIYVSGKCDVFNTLLALGVAPR